MTSENDREGATTIFNYLNQAFKADEGTAMQVMSFINKECDWLFAFFDQIPQFSLPFFALGGDFNVLFGR